MAESSESVETTRRACRRSLWLLGVCFAVQVLSSRSEAALVHSGWSVGLGQGVLHLSIPLRRPLPSTYVMRSEVILRESGLPLELWPSLSTGVVLWVGVPVWMMGIIPAARLAWCLRSMRNGAPIARCERCGYDLNRSGTEVCPECGWRRDWLRRFRRGLLDHL